MPNDAISNDAISNDAMPSRPSHVAPTDRTTPPSDDRLDAIFAALANPTRRAILERLAEGEASVNELAALFPSSLPAISKHLKVLERAALVERGRRAQFRPCRLAPAPLAAVAAWTEHYRPIWEHRLDRLADHVADRRPHTAPPHTEPPHTAPPEAPS